MLQTLDARWREHLAALDHLRQGIHLRGYAQKNPKQEYKREAFDLFAQLLDSIKLEVIRIVMNVRIQSIEQIEQAAEQLEEKAAHHEDMHFQHAEFTGAAINQPISELDQNGRGKSGFHDPNALREIAPKVGRNSPCPCGSGKKYKQCHGKLA